MIVPTSRLEVYGTTDTIHAELDIKYLTLN